MIKALLLTIFSFHFSHAQTVDIGPNLELRNELDLATQEVKPYLFDRKVQERLETWLIHPLVSDYVVDCQFRLRPFIQSPKVLGTVCYLLRQPIGKREAVIPLLKRYAMEVGAALLELQNDPRATPTERTKAKAMLSSFVDPAKGTFRDYSTQLKKCFTPAFNAKYDPSGALAFSPFAMVSSCFHSDLPQVLAKLPSGASVQMPFFAINLANEFSHHPGHAVTPTGWIPGNKATYHTENDRSPGIEKYLLTHYKLVQDLYPLTGRGSLAEMDKANPKDVFTEKEGFDSVSTHPVWAQKAGIFHAILNGFDRAQESIFIDIFFLGGSMGASLAKHLVALIEANPKLKVLILRDNINHFGHREEMLPVFNFLLAYSKKNPSRLVIGESYIEGRSSGLPSFLQDVVTDEFLKKSGLQSHLDLYGRAQSDHSKVAVIDGKTDHPTAFVGSKNWTDTSGGFCYDEVFEVSGPAAKVVQDDYYWDMRESLLKKMNTGYKGYVDTLATKGWSSSRYKAGQAVEESVIQILEPFDLLGRDKMGAAKPRQVLTSASGSALIRTGLNNVDSTRTSALDQVVQMILAAKSKILIKDQFLFDRNVVSALIRVKKANPHLDVRAILEPLKAADPAGMPNLLFLGELQEAGVTVKWKVTSDNHEVAQEYHMKTVSVDGQFVVAGSANKDNNTMYGAFREEQLDVADVASATVHDRVFESEWASPSETSPEFQGYSFTVPHSLSGLDGKPLTPEGFVQILKGLIGVLYGATVL